MPSMKQKILRVLSDGQWHNSLSIALAVGRGGPAWSWDQRKNELIRDGGFRIERKYEDGKFFWRLADPPELIDFDECRLKEGVMFEENGQGVMVLAKRGG